MVEIMVWDCTVVSMMVAGLVSPARVWFSSSFFYLIWSQLLVARQRLKKRSLSYVIKDEWLPKVKGKNGVKIYLLDFPA